MSNDNSVLTPAEQTALRLMVNDPIAERFKQRKEQMQFEADFQRKILFAMLADEDFFGRFAEQLQAEHFVADSHKMIYRLAKELLQKYGSIPTKDVLCHEIRQRLKEKMASATTDEYEVTALLYCG